MTKLHVTTQAPVSGEEMGIILQTATQLARTTEADETTWNNGEVVKDRGRGVFIEIERTTDAKKEAQV